LAEQWQFYDENSSPLSRMTIATGDQVNYNRYLIGFNDKYNLEMAGDTPRAKQRFVNNAIDHYADFQIELENWIRDQGYEHHVEDFGEPMMFPILSVRCTEELADILKEHPNIEFIRPDGIWT